MPFVDVSPVGQHFMNFSRPLALSLVACEGDSLSFLLVYGFGEYRFTADTARHDCLRDMQAMLDTLTGGGDCAEALFVDDAGQVRLLVQGEGDVLTFACYADGELLPWLQGEAGRKAFTATLRALLA